MYAKLTSHGQNKENTKLVITRKLEGEVTEEMIHEFIRQIFRDEEIVQVGPGGSALKHTERIVIDFRGRYS